jgi:hypothetical protein
MKKNHALILILTMIFSLGSILARSQNFSETAKWISNNTKGKYQISHTKDGYIHIADVYIVYFEGVKKPTHYINTISFDPRAVTSISVLKDSKGYFLRLNFTTNGTKIYKRSQDSNEIRQDIMFATDIFLEADYETALRFKKAFIKLFKNLNVNVSDGDYF